MTDNITKWFAVVFAMLGAAFTGYTRIVALEDARDGHAITISEMRSEVRKNTDRISALERDREMLERVHVIEVRLGSIENLIRESNNHAQQLRK